MTALLGIVQQACAEMDYDAPAMLVGNTDPDASQLLALAQAVGEDLLSAADWSFLIVEGATISLVAAQERYALPPDFDRLVGGTQWDRANRWRTLGPDDARVARWRRESISTPGPRRALRQVGANLTVYPIPGAGDVGVPIAFDYVSNAWAVSAGTAVAAFLTDADTVMFRPRLMMLGLQAKWLEAKGMDARSKLGAYEVEKRRALSRDKGGGRVLNLAGRGPDDEIGNADGISLTGPSVTIGTSGGAGIGID